MKKRKQTGSQLLHLKLNVQHVFMLMAIASAKSNSVYATNVTNTNDAGVGSFRNAAGGDIYFALTGTQTINLTSGPVTLSGNSPVLNPGSAASITITGSDIILGHTGVLSIYGDFNPHTITLGSNMSGSGDLSFGSAVGDQTVVLSGTNSFSSNIAVNFSDTLSIASDANLGNGILRLYQGTLAVTGATTIDNQIQLFDNSATINTAADATISGVLSSGGSLTKTGAGTLILSNDNTYSGTTTISAGTLQIGNGGTSGTLGAGNVINNSALTFNRSDASSYAGVISGSGNVTKEGSGTLTLTGTNTYSGGTTINSGTLAINNSSALGTGNIAIGNGELLASDDLTLSQSTFNFGNLSSPILSVASGKTLTLSPTTAVIDTVGTLKIGSAGNTGTLLFAPVNVTNNGINTLAVNYGTLKAGNNRLDSLTATATTNIASGAILDFNDFNSIVKDLQGAGTLNTGSAATTDITLQGGGFSGSIQGAGEIIKTTVGTLTLSGTNTYSGGTTISAGTLQIGNGGTSGTLGSGNVTNNSALNFNRSDASSYTGVISGTGTVTKQGAGTLTLSGNNTYSGTTTISGGILQIGNGGTSGTLGTGNITNNSALAFNRSNASSYAGIISATGTVTKEGAGTLTLSGNNTYSGGTNINGGAISIGADGNLGTGGALTFDGGTLQTTGSFTTNRATTLNAGGGTFDTGTTTLTHSGDIMGSGGLTKTNSGTLTLSGNNTYSGGTTVSGGTLQGSTSSLQGNITNNASLKFDQTNSGTYSGVISGSGSLTKSNTGTVILSGANTYTGNTTIDAGILSVNGSIASSATTVNSGGTLGGTGTVGHVTINSGGAFAPGNSIGTANVAGNVVFTAGSYYNVEVNAAGQSDKIIATGSATLTGAAVNVQAEAGTYANVTDYTILTAAGGLGGTTFSSVNSNLAFLTPTLSYDANNVFLKLSRNDVTFNHVANTANQLAVSNVIDGGGAALQSLYGNLLLLTDSGARQAFDSLSGVQHTQSAVTINRLGLQFQQLLFDHSSQSANGSLAFNHFNSMQSYLVADNSSRWQTAYTDTALASRRGWWTQGFGSFGEFEDTANARGANYQTGGLVFGVDTGWRDFIVGIAGSYAHSNVSPFAGGSGIDSFQAGVYGSWKRDDYYVNATLGSGLHAVDASRTVAVGTSANTASSDYDSVTVRTAVEVGKDLNLNLETTLTPYVGINYSHNNRDRFTETGAGAANLTVNEQDEDSLRTAVGFRISREFKTKHIKTITPSAMVAYVREHMDHVSLLNAGFSAAPASTFRIAGSDLDRDRLQVGAGITGQLNEYSTLNVGYNGEWASSDSHHSFAATVRFIW